eukprot:TRINITY_DN19649_c0_g1_i1.p1 TRINITY_DN19649_c0_g1~~TRINITY_DN19649_c0_g1_i1.p1  ORF type:complete len:598 (+),score=151.94 TRINITY_DN19649_c0_g1_i1:74-1867(+)
MGDRAPVRRELSILNSPLWRGDGGAGEPKQAGGARAPNRTGLGWAKDEMFDMDATPGVLQRFHMGERFTFAEGDEASEDDGSPRHLKGERPFSLDADTLAIIISFLTWEALTACLEVNSMFHQIARGALSYAVFPSYIFTCGRQGLCTDYPCVVKRVRGLDCLDPDAASDVSFMPYRFKLCPRYGPYRHRRLTFVYNHDSFVCQCVLLHPFGKILAGKTHFFLTSNALQTSQDPLQHLVALLHMSPGCPSHDTAASNCFFKVVDPTILRRADMFTTQSDEEACLPHPVFAPSMAVRHFSLDNNPNNTVHINLPDYICVGEAKCALREHLDLGCTSAVVFVSWSCTILDDWEDQPSFVTYIVVPTDIEQGRSWPAREAPLQERLLEKARCAARAEHTGASPTIRVKLLSPDLCLSSDVMLNLKQTLGVVKKNVLRCADNGNGMVILQSKAGVMLDDAGDRAIEHYEPTVFYDRALVVAYLATAHVKVHIFCPATLSDGRMNLAVNRKWSVKTFLAVVMGALRRLSQHPPAETEWCMLEHKKGWDMAIRLPSRTSLYSAKVSLGAGPYMGPDEKIEDYWDAPSSQRYFRVEVLCIHQKE